MSEPTVRVTRYEACIFPEDDINATTFTIKVEYRGEGCWAVLHRGFALGTDGQWDYEPTPGNREDAWLTTHRFSEAAALKLATEHAPKITVNGHTAAEVLEWRATRGGA